MKKFERGVLPPLSDEQLESFRQFALKHSIPLSNLQDLIVETYNDEVYMNDKYQVNIREKEEWIHLSIKRRDKQPIHDWRDLQKIKNEICGPEYEALELYPAESRLIDTSNQYHLWVRKDGLRLDLGFNDGRLVDYGNDVVGSIQRGREDDDKGVPCVKCGNQNMIYLVSEHPVSTVDCPYVEGREQEPSTNIGVLTFLTRLWYCEDCSHTIHESTEIGG